MEPLAVLPIHILQQLNARVRIREQIHEQRDGHTEEGRLRANHSVVEEGIAKDAVDDERNLLKANRPFIFRQSGHLHCLPRAAYGLQN